MAPDDFISLAGRLAATANAEEAVYRTAVSRAYYGTFHLAVSLLAELGFSAPRTANVHVFVQHHLNGSGQPSACIAASRREGIISGGNNNPRGATWPGQLVLGWPDGNHQLARP